MAELSKSFVVRGGRTIVVLILSSGLVLARPASAQVTGAEVRRAVDKGVTWLKDVQQGDGNWPVHAMTGGTTALATLALLNAGLSTDDAAVRAGLAACRQIPLSQTYVVSLKIQVLAAADPHKYLPEITAAAEWLVKAQNENGMWGYDQPMRMRGDFSNSQFALLGLHEAGKAGVKIPESVWRSAEAAWTRSQNRDGGWGYMPPMNFVAPKNVRTPKANLPSGPSTQSMTAAGVASLYIVGNSLQTRMESGFTADGAAPHCGTYSEFRPLARGLDFLGRYSLNEPKASWYYYTLYGVERVGILSGMRYLGRHDWYREGAAALIRLQREDGSWQESMPVADTAFALLFLAKGHWPLLFHKLEWTRGRDWDPDHNDLAHLTAFIGARFGQPVSWEAVPLSASVEEWRTAPILYLSGHGFPKLTPADVGKLREFVQQGGAILAEACCGRSEFRDGFSAFARQVWPDYDLHRLPPEHPVFNALFKVDGVETALQGIDVGCRTSVFFSPKDLSCLWEQVKLQRSQAAFELGANIAAYATGMEPLPDKLDVVRLARPAEGPQATQAARDAVQIAQLMHNGDWRPDAHAVAHLAEYLHDKMGVDVVPQSMPLRAADPQLAQHPIVYMTGHFSFKLSAEEIAALRQHLLRGGFLFADACCGRQAFDTSFREMVAQLFPDQPMQALAPTHPIIAGTPGVPLRQVTYKPALQKERPDLRQAMLEGVQIDERTAIVYSPFGIGCGLDGHTCYACRGLVPDDARALAGNTVLYALSY